MTTTAAPIARDAVPADVPRTALSDEQVTTLASRPVQALRHPTRWIATALVVILGLNFAQSLFTNSAWEWSKVGRWFFSEAVLGGLQLTLIATLLSAVISFVAGIGLAVARLSHNPVLSTLSWLYVWLFRSLPFILVLIFLYNAGSLYPHLGIGIPFGPQIELVTFTDIPDLLLGVIGLSLIMTAFSAEVVRAGILSVDQGQHEAADSLGIPRGRQFRRIVLPQALRSIVPAFVNLIVDLLKASSLLFYVSQLDLFGIVQNLASTYPADIIPLYVVASVWYLALTTVIAVVQYYVERFFARGALRSLPPTPLQRARSALRSIGASRRATATAAAARTIGTTR